MQRLLFELLRNSKRSDRELAKIIGVSQPTVTRMRDKLEKMGIIQEYTVVPNCAQIGIEIAAFTLINTKRDQKMEEIVVKILEKDPRVMFAAKGSGLGSNCVVFSVHDNYTDFLEFVSDLRSSCGEYMEGSQSFVMSLRTKFYKPFSFSHLERKIG